MLVADDEHALAPAVVADGRDNTAALFVGGMDPGHASDPSVVRCSMLTNSLNTLSI
jgi:hypothetical protein